LYLFWLLLALVFIYLSLSNPENEKKEIASCGVGDVGNIFRNLKENAILFPQCALCYFA